MFQLPKREVPGLTVIPDERYTGNGTPCDG